jgi:hypothetical protein
MPIEPREAISTWKPLAHIVMGARDPEVFSVLVKTKSELFGRQGFYNYERTMLLAQT